MKHFVVSKRHSINLLIYYDNALSLVTVVTSLGHIVWMSTERPLLPASTLACSVFDVTALFSLFYVAASGFGVVIYRYLGTTSMALSKFFREVIVS